MKTSNTSKFFWLAVLAVFGLFFVMTSAEASDGFRRIDSQAVVGGAIGGGAGAALGSAMGGRDGAILGSAIGAAAGVAIATPSQPRVITVDDHHHDHGHHRGYRRHRHGHHHHHD